MFSFQHPRRRSGIDMDKVEGIIRNMAHIMYGLPPGRTLAGVWMWIHDNTGGEQGRGKEMLLRSTLTGYQIGRIESSSHGNENIDEDYDFGFRIYNMARYQNLFQAALDKDGNLEYENDEDSAPFGPIERDLQSLLTGAIPRPEVSDLTGSWDSEDSSDSDSGSESDSEMGSDPPPRPSTPDSLWGGTVLQRDATTTSPGSSRPGTPPVKLFIVSDVGYSIS